MSEFEGLVRLGVSRESSSHAAIFELLVFMYWLIDPVNIEVAPRRTADVPGGPDYQSRFCWCIKYYTNSGSEIKISMAHNIVTLSLAKFSSKPGDDGQTDLRDERWKRGGKGSRSVNHRSDSFSQTSNAPKDCVQQQAGSYRIESKEAFQGSLTWWLASHASDLWLAIRKKTLRPGTKSTTQTPFREPSSREGNRIDGDPFQSVPPYSGEDAYY
jgi:hypothetical protein